MAGSGQSLDNITLWLVNTLLWKPWHIEIDDKKNMIYRLTMVIFHSYRCLTLQYIANPMLVWHHPPRRQLLWDEH